MCKHKLFLDLIRATEFVSEPLPILLKRIPEDRPRHSAHEATLPPRLRARLGRVVRGHDLLVQPGDHLLAAINPLVPVPEDERAAFPLLVEQFDALVQLPHPLGDLLRRLRVPEIFGRQGPCIEILLESAVVESPQHAGPDILLSQTTQDLQLLLPVDQVVHLRAVDS